jgi:hypothetical protein
LLLPEMGLLEAERADLRTSTVAAPPRLNQETAGAEPEPIVPPPETTATTAERTALMPDWLDAPESSIWHM